MSEFTPTDESDVTSMVSYRMKKYGSGSVELHKGAATTEFPAPVAQLRIVPKNVVVQFKKREFAEEEE